MNGRHSVRPSRSDGAHASELSRRGKALAAVSLVSGILALIVAEGSLGAGGTALAADTVSAPVTQSATITRNHLDLATQLDEVMDTRTVQVTVSTTQGLRDRQAIDVSWTGARPTGGRVPDRNSALAAEQEYPVVVMQCRGVDDGGTSGQVSPSTCWTSDPTERQAGNSTFVYPPFRVDRYAVAADRTDAVGLPRPLPAACFNAVAGAQHWVPFVASDGVAYPGGPGGCGGIAPEAGGGTSLAPSNTVYGVTERDGTGAASFVINTAESNASLGCSDTVACTLVVIPIMGISCDVAALQLPKKDRPPSFLQDQAVTQCKATGHYSPGQDTDGNVGVEDLAVSGRLWWSASNWRNRISIPLDFSVPSNVCDIVSTDKPTFMYGSQAMVQATQQWAPRFCLDPKLFKFQHVQFSEPGSRNLLATGSIGAALVGGPPLDPYDIPVVQAPVAVTGFAVALQLDDFLGRPVTELKLTPRLIAKLLTQSYPSSVDVAKDYEAISANPLDLLSDPEFRGLNEGMMTALNGFQSPPASTLLAMSGDSDVMTALTSYINADPDARTWLDGEPDPYGMVVNPSYKGLALPVTQWPLNDTFVSTSAAEKSPCLQANPAPYLPLVANPLANPATVTLFMQYGISNSQIVCQNAGLPNQKLAAVGRLVPGKRALFGIVSLGDAKRYNLPTAQLLTSTDSDGKRSFVGPSNSSLAAALRLLKPVVDQGTWPIPYSTFRTDAGKDAYPGTLLMSLNVPTAGLLQADADRYAQLLRFAASTGQTPGTGNGQLPDGYLPLTAANGADALVSYTNDAAAAVQAQQGYVPAVDGTSTPPPTATSPSAAPSTSVSSSQSTTTPTTKPTTKPTLTPSKAPPSKAASGAAPVAQTNATPSTSSSPVPPAATPTPTPTNGPEILAFAGKTIAVSPGPLGAALPALLGIAVITGVASIISIYWGRA